MRFLKEMPVKGPAVLLMRSRYLKWIVVKVEGLELEPHKYIKNLKKDKNYKIIMPTFIIRT